MIYVYTAKVNELLDLYNNRNALFLKRASLLCEERRKKVDAMKQPKDKARALGAGLLFQSVLADYLNLSAGKKDCGHRYESEMRPVEGFDEAVFERAGQMKDLRISYGEKEKPYLPDYPGLFFNISHSGDYVAVAVSAHPVGIDIQEKRKLSDGLIKKYFSEKEQKSPLPPFYIFSAKESYIKYTGEGMSRSLTDFCVDPERRYVRSGGEIAAYIRYREMEDGAYVLFVCDKWRDIIRWE